MPSLAMLLYERRVNITVDNQGPVVNISAWFGMVVMIACVFTRVASKFSLLRRWTRDDSVIFAAMIFAIGYTVMVSLMVSNGLGQPQEKLDSLMIERFEKFGYSSELLYIPALCLAKLSTLLFLGELAPGSRYATFNLILEVFIILIAISAEFATAFQCSPPRPWAIFTASKCFNRTQLTFWNTIGILDISTDFIIVLLPVCLVWHLKMPIRKKLLVIFLFGVRILIIPLSTWRLHTLNTYSRPTHSPQTPSYTYTSYHISLSTTIQLNTALFAASFPFLKPFLQGMSTGSLSGTIKELERRNEGSEKGSGSGSGIGRYLSGYGRGRSGRRFPPRGSIRMESFEDWDVVNEATGDMEGVLDGEMMDGVSEPSCFGCGNGGEGGLGVLRPEKVFSSSHIRRSEISDMSDYERNSMGDGDGMVIKQTMTWDITETFEDHKGGELSQGWVAMGGTMVEPPGSGCAV
ncbi:hypothetical protein HYFRA_00002798 [Hymenoscyphus fraxineus]|uniref:Rhodopsin domain-containing protein n=1 Tax=Hymenoscyphus fraxineus TaxID=746836 RepID=A0A9N9KNI2_9HELO|nr:hypothetical protein HYFRA_00002798 [Hymenoscyphus fraxineus]